MTDDALFDATSLNDLSLSRPQRAGLASDLHQAPERPLTEADYHERLWHILQFLHVNDPEPWPADIPTDPDDPTWEFSFGGEPMFPTTRAPFYDERISRYCPWGLEITFQPRALFDGITADTEAGQQARAVIQNRSRSTTASAPTPTSATGALRATGSGPSTCCHRTRTRRRTSVRTVTREHPKSKWLVETPAPEPAD